MAALLLISYSGILTLNTAGAATLSAPKQFRVQVFQTYNVLSWTNNVSESFLYTIIERATDQGEFIPIVYLDKSYTSYTDRSVLNGHVYRYRARTYTKDSLSPYTPVVEATILYPTSFMIGGVYVGQVDLEWSYPDLPLQRIPDYNTVIERREYNSSSWKVIATLPITETTFRDKDVSANSYYYYRIRVKYASDRYSAYFPSDYGTLTDTAFPLNTPLWGYGLSDGTIRLEWDTTNAGGGTAVIEKQNEAGDFVFLQETNLSYIVDTNVLKGKTYTYRLRMRSTTGKYSEYTDEISITAEQVPAPADLTAAAYDSEKIILSWYYPFDDETGFEIWRKAEAGKWEKVALVPKNSDVFADYSAILGVTYAYRIRAVRGDKVFSAFSSETSIANMFPESPGQILSYIENSVLFIFSEKPAPVNTTYTLEYRRDINSPWQRLINVENQYLTVKLNTEGVKGNYFRIRANIGGLETIGPEMYFSGTAPEAPGDLKVRHVGYSRVVLTWEDRSDTEDGYYIYRSVKNADGSIKKTLAGSAEKDAESYIDSSPPAGSDVYYEVTAYNISGESKAANISVKTPARVNYTDLGRYQWALDAIYTLQGLGAFDDSPNRLFDPENVVSRGQLARMIIKSFNIPYGYSGLRPPADITPKHMYYEDIMTALNLGILHPDADGNVYPNRAVTRRDVLVMLNGALGNAGLSLVLHDKGILERFSDYGKVIPEEADIIASFIGESIISGKNGQLSLQTYSTKAETSAFIYRTLKRYKLI